MKSPIYFVERNIHGGYAIYGLLGVRQFYGYTKAEAIQKYKEAYENTFVVNKSERRKKC